MARFVERDMARFVECRCTLIFKLNSKNIENWVFPSYDASMSQDFLFNSSAFRLSLKVNIVKLRCKLSDSTLPFASF
mgnify:CR=1 FL=1